MFYDWYSDVWVRNAVSIKIVGVTQIEVDFLVCLVCFCYLYLFFFCNSGAESLSLSLSLKICLFKYAVQ